MKIYLTALTHVGKVREINEDSVAICCDLTRQRWFESDGYIPLSAAGALAVVADGMGGANAGEVASNLAIEQIRNCFMDKELPVNTSDSEKCEFLKKAITQAGSAILTHVETDPETIGMGTTIVVLWIEKCRAHVAWCGDSRCYVFNPDKGLSPLTKDHSYVQELVDKGELRPDQMIGHPDSNIITRGLGDIDTDSTAEALTFPITEGDIFLLCSDGLCGYCNDTTIEKIIYKHINNLSKCSLKLLESALKTGGYDNISIAILSTLPDSTKRNINNLSFIHHFISSLVHFNH